MLNTLVCDTNFFIDGATGIDHVQKIVIPKSVELEIKDSYSKALKDRPHVGDVLYLSASPDALNAVTNASQFLGLQNSLSIQDLDLIAVAWDECIKHSIPLVTLNSNIDIIYDLKFIKPEEWKPWLNSDTTRHTDRVKPKYKFGQKNSAYSSFHSNKKEVLLNIPKSFEVIKENPSIAIIPNSTTNSDTPDSNKIITNEKIEATSDILSNNYDNKYFKDSQEKNHIKNNSTTNDEVTLNPSNNISNNEILEAKSVQLKTEPSICIDNINKSENIDSKHNEIDTNQINNSKYDIELENPISNNYSDNDSSDDSDWCTPDNMSIGNSSNLIETIDICKSVDLPNVLLATSDNAVVNVAAILGIPLAKINDNKPRYMKIFVVVCSNCHTRFPQKNTLCINCGSCRTTRVPGTQTLKNGKLVVSANIFLQYKLKKGQQGMASFALCEDQLRKNPKILLYRRNMRNNNNSAFKTPNQDDWHRGFERKVAKPDDTNTDDWQTQSAGNKLASINDGYLSSLEKQTQKLDLLDIPLPNSLLKPRKKNKKK